MSAPSPTTCPSNDQLCRLVTGGLSAPDEAALTAHLDACGCCQQALERQAGGDETHVEHVRHLDDTPPPGDSAYWPALERLGVEARREPPTLAVADTAPDNELSLAFLAPPEAPGTIGRFSHFDVVRVLGRGGMGVVFEAIDTCLQRRVAVKVLDPQLARDETYRKRFCREARAAAAVTHENVVVIYFVDETEDGLPHLVMQYVAGENLQQRLDRGGAVLPAEAVRVGQQVADGLAAAHAQGLIHRDVKPGNILLPAVPRGSVKLTDFGLARAAEDARLTQTGFTPGTPQYMSPEQARGEAVDHRTDLFSLGGVLYAMATGRAPFQGSSAYMILRQVTEEQPPPVRELNPAVPDWLEAVIERLLAKDPAERYQSAAEVAEVLAEGSKQLAAAPPRPLPTRSASHRSTSPGGRAGFYTALALAGLFGGLLAADVAGLLPLRRDRTAGAADAAPSPALLKTINADAGVVWSVAFSPDGHTLAVATEDGTVKLWDVAESSVRATLPGHRGTVWAAAFSPDGTTLATASDDGTVRLWDLAASTRHTKFTLAHPASVRAVAFADGGRAVVTGSRDGRVTLWDAATGKELAKLEAPASVLTLASVGDVLASGGTDRAVTLWDAPTREARLPLRGHTGVVYGVALTADGRSVASTGWDGTVRLWDTATGNEVAALTGHTEDVWSVAFSPDGALLASVSNDRAVRVWDVANQREHAVLTGHTGAVHAVAFAPDGKTVASGGRDGTVRLWSVDGAAGPAR
jgi:WD40 repeat protein/tRNA A-37 threonylcarbamoyl transferase component Bud32